MAIDVGSQVGAYEILALIGEGGMGRVFRARDTRLKREVAIKTLPPEFAGDPERVGRFRREAEALAAISHPHIAGIYDLVDASGSQVLVLEMVEGETLAARIELGPIPIPEALTIARQIADALEAAHARGIVHRDLKPANVKITPDGAVKVLDFGLAKSGSLDAASGPNLTQSPTVMGSTRAGVILGTASYMSPEQARGQRVDAQSDIWAFACVLYEMVTAQQAFGGATVADVLGAVVRGEPDWSRLPSETPPALRMLLRRCLQKDRARRLHHIADARIELEEVALAEPHDGARPAPVAARSARWAWLTAAALFLLASALAGALALVLRREASPPPMQVEITTPPSLAPAYLAIAPDGRAIAFVATGDGVSRLWLRRLDSPTAQPLAGTEFATAPFWSPDSRSLGFFADGRLKRFDIAGGLTRTIANAPIAAGGSWNRDGTIIFAPSAIGPLLRVSAAGGETAPLTRLLPQQTGHRLPQFLPDQRHFLFYARGDPTTGGIFVGSLDGGEARRILESETAGVLTASGHVLYVRQGTLLARAFDAERLETVGDDIPVADRVAFDADVNLAAVTASIAGPVAYRTGFASGQRQLVWFDRAGQRIGAIGQPDTTSLFNPELSSDGRYVALNRTVEAYQDIWLVETARGLLRRFTFDPGSDQIPVWSPDGQRIVFSSNRKTTYDLYEKPASGLQEETLLLASPLNKFPMAFSSDGRFLLYRQTAANTNWDLWALPLGGNEPATAFPVVSTAFQEMMGEFSPDGRWIAYQSNESGRYEVYVQSFPEAGMRRQISTNGGSQPRWRRDSKELFYIGLDAQLMAASIAIDAKQQLQSGTPTPLFPTRTAGGPVPIPQKHQYVVGPDGDRFLLNTLTDEASTAPITLLLNWSPH